MKKNSLRWVRSETKSTAPIRPRKDLFVFKGPCLQWFFYWSESFLLVWVGLSQGPLRYGKLFWGKSNLV